MGQDSFADFLSDLESREAAADEAPEIVLDPGLKFYSGNIVAALAMARNVRSIRRSMSVLISADIIAAVRPMLRENK